MIIVLYFSKAKNFHTMPTMNTWQTKAILQGLLADPPLDVTKSHLHLYTLPTALNDNGLVKVLVPATFSHLTPFGKDVVKMIWAPKV